MILLILIIFLWQYHLHSYDIEENKLINIKIGNYEYQNIPTGLLSSKDSMLNRMLKYENYKDKDGNYLIYRTNGHMFKYILDFLENGQVEISNEKEIYDLIKEANYFCIHDLLLYLRKKILNKKIPYNIWSLFTEDELMILKIPQNYKKYAYFIYNKDAKMIIGDKSVGYDRKAEAQGDLDLRKGNIVPAWNGTCSLPHNCFDNTCIGLVKKYDDNFDPALIMEHIYNGMMCSRWNEGYAIFDIISGKRILPQADFYFSLDECIETLLSISQ